MNSTSHLNVKSWQHIFHFFAYLYPPPHTHTPCFVFLTTQVNIPHAFLSSRPHLNFPFVADWCHYETAPMVSQVHLAQDTATWVMQELPGLVWWNWMCHPGGLVTCKSIILKLKVKGHLTKWCKVSSDYAWLCILKANLKIIFIFQNNYTDFTLSHRYIRI